MNEVTFTISHCNDCPESLFWKSELHNDTYVCGKFSENTKINTIKIVPIVSDNNIPYWCPLLGQKNYIKKATGELL